MTRHTRRSFCSIAAGALASTACRTATPVQERSFSGDRVNVALIGLGLRGQLHMAAWSKIPGARIVAVCDVNQDSLDKGKAKVKRLTGTEPKGYTDLRHVFDDKDVQAVSMPLPNHWHALATIWACQAGKDVYIEKPACHNPFEGQKMIEAARAYNRIVQVGAQDRSTPHYIQAIEQVHGGAIGKLYLARGLCYKLRPSIGHKVDEPVPATLDWAGFLGPAPMRPYNELRYRYNWNFFWDTGNGDIGNQGIHEMDNARWALAKQEMPDRVVSTGGKYIYNDDQETPNTQQATIDYGDSEIEFEVRGLSTGGEGELGAGYNVIANLFYGSTGWLSLNSTGFKAYKGVGMASQKFMDVKAPKNDAFESMNTIPHMENFLAAVRSRDNKILKADIAEGVASANLVHLSNASYRLKRELKCAEQDAELSALLTRQYRVPYVVPEKV